MLRLENSLLCKQNGITSQIVYYHFQDRALHFFWREPYKLKKSFSFLYQAPVIPKCCNWQCLEKLE